MAMHVSKSNNMDGIGEKRRITIKARKIVGYS